MERSQYRHIGEFQTELVCESGALHGGKRDAIWVLTIMHLNFQPLDEQISCTGFDCGKPALNHYLQNYALTNQKRRLSATTAVLSEAAEVVGYYTLAAAQVPTDQLPRKFNRSLPKYPTPAIRLCRLAIDLTLRGQGMGRRVLLHALTKCVRLSRELGCFLVIVDAKDENAHRFYERFGFIPLEEEGRSLFLPVKTIESAFIQEPVLAT